MGKVRGYLVGERSGTNSARPLAQRRDHPKGSLASALVSDLGFRDTTDTALPPSTPDPQHEIAHPDTAVRPRWVPASWDKEGSCCWFLISGVSFPIEFCSWLLPVLPVGRAQLLVGERSGPDRATNRASVSDLGFRGTTDTVLPPFNTRPPTPDRPTWYPCTPGPCSRETVPERLRTGPDTAVNPASDGVLRA